MTQPHGIAVKLSRDPVDRHLGFLARREGVSHSAVALEEHRLIQPQRTENGSSTRLEFRGDAMPFSLAGSCVDYAAVGKPLAGFSFVMEGNKLFPNDKGDGSPFTTQEAALRCSLHVSQSRMEGDSGNVRNRGWNVDGNVDLVSGGGGSDGDEDDNNDADEIDDDEFDDGDGEIDGLATADGVNANKNSNTSSGSVQSSSEKISCFGFCVNGMRENPGEQHRHCEEGDNYGNSITVVEPVSTPQKAVGDNVYSFCNKRRQGSFSVYPGESVRAHLSDPVTGILMDDAIILPCGHSFGVGGMQHVQQMKACFKCLLPFSEDSVRPNLALRVAVQAFLREEESHSSRISKRRRNRFELDRYANDDQLSMDSQSRGVQFPFNVSDRVIIKGNKRTPERFVGRIAVVTTQCLNGWYVVKTLDNAESVKLQYRSLEKVPDDSSNFIGNKAISSNWL
ncbi:U-box domain-containing protein 62 [Platanthera guangdongensis]|uniref:U-box domain-containing protein 62 n=1 Tax=Platanthera guangdongensis TaxID=2320717 RepID=A0ABR2LVK4_9ASPA